MRNSKTPDIVLLIIAILVFLAAIGLGYYYYNQMSDTLANCKVKENEVKLIQNKLRDLPSLLSKIESLESEEKRLSTFIPTQEEQEKFVWELEKLADVNNVKIKRCNIAKDVKTLKSLPQYLIYQWRLDITGDFHSLTNFLNSLPYGNRAVMPSELHVASTTPSEKDNTSSYVLSVNLTLDLISRRVQEKVTK